ncbi:hypothetical protein ACHAO8_002758 [Botrytis cinerea]
MSIKLNTLEASHGLVFAIHRRSKSNPTNGSACYVTNLSAKTLSILIAKYKRCICYRKMFVGIFSMERMHCAELRTLQLLYQASTHCYVVLSQLANGHMVLFKDKLKIDTPLFSEGIAYINCNNIPMTQSVSSLSPPKF